MNPRIPAFACLFVLLLGSAAAQDLSGPEVMENVKETAQSIEDAAFTVLGSLIDPDGTEIRLDVDVEVVPEARAARATFLQPDALADNFIVFDGDAVYNYIFLTNQVTVFDADDPDALGGLFPEAEDEAASFGFTLDLDALFEGWEATTQDYVDTPEGTAYLIRFDNADEEANIDHVLAEIIDGTWVPYSMKLFTGEDEVMADLTFENFERDSGLDPADVTYIPDDAEIIDERSR